MSERRKSAFKSRFSILSLLPSRHPPLLISRPEPLHVPPSQPVPRYPTIVAPISPVHSEHVYTDSNLSPAILDAWDAPGSSRAGRTLELGMPNSSEALEGPRPSRFGAQGNATSPRKQGDKKRPRPPPLDLSRANEVYPGPKGMDVEPQGEEQSRPAIPPIPFRPGMPVRPTRPAMAPTLEMPAATVLPPAKAKPEVPRVLDDPFEFAVVEPGHRYTSWKGGKVDIKPGQIIPRGTIGAPMDTPTIRGIPDESVLHDILLTPTYLNPSPTPPSLTPSDGASSANSQERRRNRRRTIIDRAADLVVHAARKSKIVPKGILKVLDEEGASRSVQLMREREQRQMDRFRQKNGSGPSVESIPDRQVYEWRNPSSLKDERKPRLYKDSGKSTKSKKGDKQEKEGKEEAKAKWKKLWKLGALLAIIVLAILTVALCTTLLTRSNKNTSQTAGTSSDGADGAAEVSITATPTSITSAPTSTTTSAALSTCLAQFSAASTSPSSYPCADCVPLLTSTTNDYLFSLVDGNATGVGAALQFCALMDIKKAADGLDGWGNDTSPCGGWDGVTCDDRGRLTELKLQYPDIPSTLPSTLANLVSLEALRLLGNSSIPTGDFPNDILNLTNMSTIDLEYTALTGPIHSIEWSRGQKLTTVYLVNNEQLGSGLPDLSSNTKLVTLAVTNQGLTNVSESNLPSSLTYLDLSWNDLTGTVPPFSSLVALQTLYMTNNDLDSPPASLPSTLTSLSLTSNANLAGDMPSEICELPALTNCDLRSTSLGGEANATASADTSGKVCGVCQYS